MEHIDLFLRVQNDSVVFGLKPFHSIILGELVGMSNAASFAFSVSDIHARTTKNNIEIHTINTNGGIVLDTQVNVFLNTKAEIAVLAEVVATQFIFTDL